jgi:hypothetical protein
MKTLREAIDVISCARISVAGVVGASLVAAPQSD